MDGHASDMDIICVCGVYIDNGEREKATKVKER